MSVTRMTIMNQHFAADETGTAMTELCGAQKIESEAMAGRQKTRESQIQ